MAREMKDSGIVWIGEIPREWEIRKLKTYINFVNGFAFDGSILEKEGTYPIIRIGDIKGGTIDFKNACFINEADEELEQFRVAKGDILIAMSGATVGKLAFVTFEPPICFINQRVGIIRGSLGKYLYYYLSTDNFMKYILLLSEGTAQPNISTKNINNYFAVIPPETIREQIVSSLEVRCAHIDSVIVKTHAAIEEYKKLKQAVITQAVTKGIRPNREMRDSGIEWIGETPEEWNILKIKYLFTIKKDIAGEEGYQVLSITQRGIKPKDLSKNEGQLAANYSNYQIVNIGDFAMNHMDLLTGWVDISKYYGVTSPDYRVFRLFDIENNNSRYYLYLMQLCYFNRVFYGLGQGVSGMGRWRLQADKFLNMYIVNPPIDEQSEIVSYLDEKTAAIDSLIQKKEQLITELEAYKKSLIYEYVTGKKEVSDNETIALSLDFQIALLICNILKNTDVKGRIHLQKVIFALDTLLGLFSGTQYYRYPHGPYDLQIEKYESIIVKQGWVVVDKSKGYVRYTKTDKFMEFESLYQDVFKERDKDIRKICNLFNVKRTSKAEKMATLLASWNDFLIDGVAPTDDMIINDIVTNWTVNKANIAKETWREELRQLKEKQLIPKGYGKHTLKKEQNDYAH